MYSVPDMCPHCQGIMIAPRVEILVGVFIFAFLFIYFIERKNSNMT